MKLHSEDVSIYYDLLSESELLYLKSLMEDKSKWKFWIEFNESNQYFDSIGVDKDRLKSYLNILTENGKNTIKEIGLNLIQPSRQLDNSTHFDDCDFSYVTYLNDTFSGGDFVYFVDGVQYKITPQKGLTIKLKNKIKHRVEIVNEGKRFSLYTFLMYPKKSSKTLF